MAGGVALANSMLVRHGRGFLEITDPSSISEFGRVEGYLMLGNLVDPVEIQQQVTGYLALSGQLSLTITATVQPTGSSDTPYEGFDLGDTITAPDESGIGTTNERVVTFTVTEDEEGQPIFATEIGVPAVIYEQRIKKWLDRLLNGTQAGTAATASPLLPQVAPAVASNDEIITFDQPGADSSGSPILLASGQSNAVPVNQSGVLYKVVVFLDGPTPGYGTGPNTLTVYVNHVSIGTVTIPAGKQGAIGYFNVPVRAALTLGATTPPDVVSVNFTTVDGVATGAHIMISVH